MFPAYRNQSVDSKSTDWFLYVGSIGRQRVNVPIYFYVR